jgi:penicillin-binding protein 1C
MRLLRKKKKNRRWKYALYFALSLLLIASGFLFFAFAYLLPNLPDPNIITQKIRVGGLEIYDRTGQYLLYQTGFRQKWLSYEEIPQKVILATLAAEDIEFFKHHGISWRGILRSLWLNLKTKSLSYGGSTITQQLVRNIFLSQEKSLWRKLKEIVLALEIERKYSKEEILTYYLNIIYYGLGNIGVEAASEFYFGKRAQDLDWSEASVLASIPKSPGSYAPLNEENLKRLKIRRDYIIDRLVSFGYLDKNEAKKIKEQKIKISRSVFGNLSIAPHFVQEVLSELKNMYPNQEIETLGLKVITTLNFDLQKKAEKIVWQRALENEKKYGGKNAALMAIDPLTGEVLALVGSKDFFDEKIDGQVNVPFWFRQPGSAFKPLVYASLFELGYPDETIVFDVPTNFGTEKEKYEPKNFDEKFRGPLSLRIALAQSINVPSIKVFYLAFPERVVDLARKSGMSYLRDWNYYGLSLGIGTAEVRMADLIRFYGALANDGILVSQSLIKEIINMDGKIVFRYKPKEERILSENAARLVTDILKDVEARKGLFQSSLYLTIFPDYEIALKTGTTQLFRDAWTFGYARNFVVGVWAGNTDGTPMQPGGVSIVAALPIFHDFMLEAIKMGLVSQEKFTPPIKSKIEKPMLNGQFLTPYGIHDILFYVDRNNPLSPEIPGYQSKDPMFWKWEEGVRNWLTNVP